MFLFEYDIITSYMKDFSALKCIAIIELFYVTIYKQVFIIWFKESQTNGNIYAYLKIVLHGWLLIFSHFMRH